MAGQAVNVRAAAIVSSLVGVGYWLFLQASGSGPRKRSSATPTAPAPAPAAATITTPHSNISIIDMLGSFIKSSIGIGMQISQQGLLIIKEHEQLRLSVYTDGGGYPTIGWGHLIKPGENYETITQAQADSLLIDDLGTAVDAVNRYVKVELTQGQFDALVSLTFNIGAGNLADSTLLRKLNAGDYDGAAAEFTKWRKSNGIVLAGLVARRAQEKSLFIASTTLDQSGTYA